MVWKIKNFYLAIPFVASALSGCNSSGPNLATRLMFDSRPYTELVSGDSLGPVAIYAEACWPDVAAECEQVFSTLTRELTAHNAKFIFREVQIERASATMASISDTVATKIAPNLDLAAEREIGAVNRIVLSQARYVVTKAPTSNALTSYSIINPGTGVQLKFALFDVKTGDAKGWIFFLGPWARSQKPQPSALAELMGAQKADPNDPAYRLPLTGGALGAAVAQAIYQPACFPLSFIRPPSDLNQVDNKCAPLALMTNLKPGSFPPS